MSLHIHDTEAWSQRGPDRRYVPSNKSKDYNLGIEFIPDFSIVGFCSFWRILSTVLITRESSRSCFEYSVRCLIVFIVYIEQSY
jgi:hypothetical protein